MFSQINIDKISIATTIAITGLVIALIASIFYGSPTEVVIGISSGLTGYIGGRSASGHQEVNHETFKSIS